LVYVVFDFIQLPIPEKAARGRNVYAEMNANPAFPMPDVPLNRLRKVLIGLKPII
jgi:hypothetical protein